MPSRAGTSNEPADLLVDGVQSAQRDMVSVVFAVYNEQDAVPLLLDQLKDVLDTISLDYEIVAVDDGSKDQSLAIAREKIRTIPKLRVVEMYRNYGQVAAASAGLSVARGKWVVTMDGDLQHDPKDIPRFVAEIANGHDLVATYRAKRDESLRRKIISFVGNRVNRFLVGLPIMDFGSSFRLFSARLLDMFTDDAGYVHYNTPGLYGNARSYVELPITQAARPFGSSKWGIMAFIMFNIDFFAHSKKLVQFLLNVGILGMITGLVLYLLTVLGFGEPSRAISAPMTISFTSFLVIILTVIWREVMVLRRDALGQPPYLIAGVWMAGSNGSPERDDAPLLRAELRPARNARP